MRICELKYPKGSYKGQKENGLGFDGLLYENLEVLSDGIINDNSFLLLISAQALSVRTGKSTFTQLLSMAWIDIMKKRHNIDLDFSMDNLAFSAEEFEQKAFLLHEKKQRFGPCVLDESDDLTGHALSQEVKRIKRFLRKSGQLNLLMIMILPDFFEFPKQIAVNRSVALITVDFGEKFSRGYWKFYDFKAKKMLYIKGKQYEDYGVVQPTLFGSFVNCGYLVDEQTYRKAKYRDLQEDAQKQKENNLNVIKRNIMMSIFKKVVTRLKGILTIDEVSELFNIERRTATNWLNAEKERQGGKGYNINLVYDDNSLEAEQVAAENN